MGTREFSHVTAAVIIFTAIISFSFIVKHQWENIAIAFFFAIIILGVNIIAKKITAHLLDSDVEHELWQISQYGYVPHEHFKHPAPAGIIAPLLLNVFTLGFIKFPAMLTYETNVLKHRAAKRFGFYSYTEMTDWHTALIGASGILAVLILSVILYFIPSPNIEYFARIAVYYAFVNLIPFSKLDGSQIFFGSRILWSTLAIITVIMTAYALLLI